MQSKGEILYNLIRNDILSGKYKPNEIFTEGRIAGEYGYSKTPARDALSVLAQQGFVTKFSRVGYCVKMLTPEENYKLTHLRYILEIGIYMHIISECSDEEIVSLYKFTQGDYVGLNEYNEQNKLFHIEVAKLTKNEFIVNEIEKILNSNTQWTSSVFFNREENDAHIRHKELIKLLLNRNFDKVLEWEKNEMIWADEQTPRFLQHLNRSL